MPVARYQVIAEELIQQIGSGALAIGALLPTEAELMAVYGTSRNTVRMAMQQLQARGLISRRRNRGTMVEAVPGGVATFSQSLSFDNLVALASTARRQVIASDDVVLDSAAAKLIQCAPGSRWLRIAMLRSIVGKARPLGWTDAFVDLRYRQLLELAQDHPDKLLADLVENVLGRRIDRVEQTVSSGSVDARMAAALGAARGTPALRVLRHYRDAVRGLVIVTSTVYPENRYSLTSTLIRSG